ncbi:unnamed protein product [Withania somnifera]
MASFPTSSTSFLNKDFVSLSDFSPLYQFPTQNLKRRFSKKIVSVITQPSPRIPATTGSVKNWMTMTEKLLAKNSEELHVVPGENLWVNFDVLMTHYISGPGAIGVFKREFGENAKVWDREKLVVIPDHYIFPSDERANGNVDTLRDFCNEQNIKYFYDIKDLGNFQVLVGTDSHTCTAGAFGQFASGIGNTDAGFVQGTGKILLKVPPTIRFVLDGEISNYILAKRFDFAKRMTLCNMVIEAGGKNGVIPADKATYEGLDKTTVHYEPVYSDEKARFHAEYHFDILKLEPLVARDVKIDRVYIGYCTCGKTEDFMAAAKFFLASFLICCFFASSYGKKVKVPTFLVPATQKVWMDLYTFPVPESGGKTCSQIFEDAGCDTPASPSCGACMGGPRDTHARLNEPQVCVSTTNRNFLGRMGHKEGQIYLASPCTAAASALTLVSLLTTRVSAVTCLIIHLKTC